MKTNTVRIIGGKYRGKKLTFPSMPGLRPTSDRIRETLFNWLMHDIQQSRCLDVFAGSGALGFEAFSRGAAQVVLLEKMYPIYQNLQTTAQSFASSQITVIHSVADDYLHKQIQNPNAVFDIIFLDPPFLEKTLFSCINLFEQSHLLAEEGLLYTESPDELLLNPQFWQPLKIKKSGLVTYALYQKKSPSRSSYA